MLFEDTPNPNAKKIVVDHDYEVGIYLDKNKQHDDFIQVLLKNEHIQNIFTGPNFLTILKSNEGVWTDIIEDFKKNN